MIFINSWISTRIYKSKNISIVLDLKNSINYILKGEISSLWSIIVSSKSYEKTFDYAKRHKIEEELNQFLLELKQKDIIVLDNKKPPQINVKYLSYAVKNNSDIADYLDKKERNIIINNHLAGKLYLELNYKCNLNCKHCCNPKDCNNVQITFESAKRIIDEAFNIGLHSLFLTGGECTINKDFLKIAKYAREKHIFLNILTNAQKLYDDKILFEELISIYPSFYISLYSMKPDIHDYITGVKGSHHKTISVIKKLRKNNLPVSITNVILAYNSQCYKDTEIFAKSIGAEHSYYVRFINNPKNNNLNTKLCEKEMEKFYFDNLDTENIRNFKKDEQVLCKAGCVKLSIAPNLDITPCVYFNHILGNYNNISLKEIKEEIIPEFQKNFTAEKLNECFKHNYCKYCIYCAVVPALDEGFMKKSEILCQDAKAYYKALLLRKNVYEKSNMKEEIN